MKIDLKNCSEEELWKYVGKHLSANGFDAVLVGGAVVSIYSKGAYQSGDLDLIIQNLVKDKLPEVMSQIGFIKKGRHYIHPECKHLFVEFPSGPLEIGDDYKIKPMAIDIEGYEIKILSPTDCIKDRLATYIYFNDYEGMEQALLVASSQSFNLNSVKNWCQSEGRAEVFNEFVEGIKFRSSN